MITMKRRGRGSESEMAWTHGHAGVSEVDGIPRHVPGIALRSTARYLKTTGRLLGHPWWESGCGVEGNRLKRHLVSDFKFFEDGAKVLHKEVAAAPSCTPFLPVVPMFHGHDEIDTVLELHVVDPDLKPRRSPFPIVRRHILAQANL